MTASVPYQYHRTSKSSSLLKLSANGALPMSASSAYGAVDSYLFSNGGSKLKFIDIFKQ